MHHILYNCLLTVSLLVGMLLLLEIGRRMGIRRMAQEKDEGAGLGAVEGAVFSLLGLLIAFILYGAAARFDTRRQLIVEETNAIGTAYLRLDLLPTEAQPALREHFRRYVEARLEVYRKLPDLAAAQEALAKTTTLQGEIWRHAVAAVRAEGALPQAAVVLLPALNVMIDITTTRTMATRMHPPLVIFVLLFGLALVASLLAGYGMAGSKARRWLPILGFVVVITVSVYVILDLEFPRLGFIRVDAFDQALVELRESMQ
jgi:hypothetical protein